MTTHLQALHAAIAKIHEEHEIPYEVTQLVNNAITGHVVVATGALSAELPPEAEAAALATDTSIAETEPTSGPEAANDDAPAAADSESAPSESSPS